MNKAEIKKPLDYEIWHTEEDKDVLLVSPDETFFSNKKRILQHYLKRANDNVVSFELEEEEKNKLKKFYILALEKAKILREKKGDILQKEIVDKVCLRDKKYFESDDEGNQYLSDDI